MDEKKIQTLIDVLIEKIKEQQSEIFILKLDNERLKESLKTRLSVEVCEEDRNA